MLSVVLALAAGISWGVADFLGGLNSRHLSLATVLLVSQTVGLLLLLPLAAAHGWPLLDGPTAAFAVAGSVSGLIGIAALYRGMAVGSISIVAPISATGAALPILFGLLRGERATPLQSAGIVLAAIGILLASRAVDDPLREANGALREPQDPDAKVRVRVASGVGFALLAALGFGGFFVLLHEASVADVLWAGAVQRLTGVCIMLVSALILRPTLAIGWRRLPGLVMVGALDASANVLYSFASVVGLVSVAAVLASLFPVVSVILARVILRERLSPIQGTGVVCALAGVAFIAGYADAPV
jgi:drug/metabolite transporter (DMT)-like permease